MNAQHSFQLNAFLRALFLIFSAEVCTCILALKAQAPVVPVSISGSVFF